MSWVKKAETGPNGADGGGFGAQEPRADGAVEGGPGMLKSSVVREQRNRVHVREWETCAKGWGGGARE